ncbi:substrate-binding periplasmic protein [Bdellovibrio sp. HCB2-146]|uniref:substrate-binding periplasmic protein n=1 Tax=Bdellovibrio sp. HCB2-146 TaxID=3394362 RepID=UPI0039BD3743
MKALALLLIIFSSLAQAAPKKDCQRTYRVSVNPIAPVSYRDENGKIRGIARDLGEVLTRKTGCRFSIEEEPTFEVWRSLQNDRTDMTMVNIENATPAASFGHFILFYTVPRSFVTRRELLTEGTTWQSLFANKKLKFVGLIGVDFFYSSEEIAELKKQKRWIEVVGLEEAFSLIAQKRADVIVSSPGATHINLQRMGLNDQLHWVLDEKNLRNAGMYVSKRRLNKEEFEMIKSAIESLKDEGWFKDNLKKYIDSSYQRVEQKKVPAKNPQ